MPSHFFLIVDFVLLIIFHVDPIERVKKKSFDSLGIGNVYSTYYSDELINIVLRSNDRRSACLIYSLTGCCENTSGAKMNLKSRKINLLTANYASDNDMFEKNFTLNRHANSTYARKTNR